MYEKSCYVFNGNQMQLAVVRNYRMADCQALIAVQQESFPPPFPSELWWTEEQLLSHMALFSEGALCVELNGEIVGSITSLILPYGSELPSHTWAEATDNGYIRNHDPAGDTLYVVDICVRPHYRSWGLAKLLMQSLYEVVVALGLKRLLGGGRMPGYYSYADRLTAEQYVAAVCRGELKDAILTFLLRCGRMPVKVIPNYLEDEESCNYAALMEWRNPFIHVGGGLK